MESRLSAELPGALLRRVDKSLDELESNPLPLQRELYELSRSPAAAATGSALGAAAKVSASRRSSATCSFQRISCCITRSGEVEEFMQGRACTQATVAATKAAVPVAQVLLREGGKAAVALMSRALAEAAKQQARGSSSSGKSKASK
jgi:hypothetical protein